MSEPGETIDIDRPSSEHGAPSSGSPGSIDAVGSQTTGVQPGAPDASSAQEHGVGTAIGRFVVLGTLGHGGMGTVYDAFDRTLDRRVAVKVLKPDVAPQQEQRLLREALALAQLSHPNVVQVYEIGEADGRAFVAMELVEGQTLRRWSTADPRPSWRACVEVYLQAGAGLAAAHERGVLHRDFKPSNAVVDRDGRVRVLDFGLARTALEPGSSSRLSVLTTGPGASTPGGRPRVSADIDQRLTATGQLMGTLAYMPLEQMRGDDVDPRADQFSFCVSLFEAVHGRRPFSGRSFVELEDQLYDEKIVAVPRDTAVPARLQQILGRGLAATPERRWPSMLVLLEQLEGLVAPRRRRSSWALGGAVVVGLGLGAGLTYQAQAEPRCERALAEIEPVWNAQRGSQLRGIFMATELPYAIDTWSRVRPALDDYTRAWTEAHTDACEATRVQRTQSEDVLDLRMRCLGERKQALAAVAEAFGRADTHVVSKAVDMVGRLPRIDACEDVARLQARRQRIAPPQDAQVATEVQDLRAQLAAIQIEHGAGRYERGITQVDPVVARAHALGYAPVEAEALALRARLHTSNRQHAESERDFAAAYALAAGAGYDEVAVDAAMGLAYVVGNQQARHAQGLLWGQVAESMAAYEGDPVQQAEVAEKVGLVLYGQGKFADAEQRILEAIELRAGAQGAEHPDVGMLHNALGNVLLGEARYSRAEEHYRIALESKQRVLAPDHPDIAKAASNLGLALDGQGKHAQAEPWFQRAVEIFENSLGPTHPYVAAAIGNHAMVLSNLGRNARAVELYRRALKLQEDALGPDDPDVAINVNNLGSALAALGSYEEAEQQIQRALALREQLYGPVHPLTAETMTNLGDLYRLQGKYDEAEPLFLRSLDVRRHELESDHPALALSHVGLARVELGRGRPSAAREHAERALEINEASDAEPSAVATARWTLAQALWFDRGQRARAVTLAEQARADRARQGDSTEAIDGWLADERVRDDVADR